MISWSDESECAICEVVVYEVRTVITKPLVIMFFLADFGSIQTSSIGDTRRKWDAFPDAWRRVCVRYVPYVYCICVYVCASAITFLGNLFLLLRNR